MEKLNTHIIDVLIYIAVHSTLLEKKYWIIENPCVYLWETRIHKNPLFHIKSSR